MAISIFITLLSKYIKTERMPFYQKNGTIPNKRHVVSRQSNGNLYHEELVGTEGFSGMSSLVYHLHPPTMVKEMGERDW